MPGLWKTLSRFVPTAFAFAPLIQIGLAGTTAAADTPDPYQARIAPFMQKYCVSCHNQKEARGELDLTRYGQAADVSRSFRRWNNIVEFIRHGEMPPEDAKLQPTPPEREQVAATVEAILLEEAKQHAGDPGVVLPRRLSNTEYDRSIHDLTGVDIRPTRDFPADPAAGEGFDNTGEALTMSPSLLKKYLSAAQEVANHLVLKTHGITFAPFPVTSYNERKKLTEQAIIDFYHSHDVQIRDYLTAAWQYRHRGRSQQQLSLEDWAREQNLSPRYLTLVWETLNNAHKTSGFMQQVGQLWEAIPAPVAEGGIPAELNKLNDYIEFMRRKVGHREEQLIRSNAGNWPISHLDFRAKTAALRDKFDPSVFQSKQLIASDRIRAPKPGDKNAKDVTLYIRLDQAFAGSQGDYVLLERPIFSKSNRLPRNEKEIEQQEVVTLQEFLQEHAPQVAQKFNFGQHPDQDIPAESLLVKAPALIEIPLTVEMQQKLDGKQLVFECRLDPTLDKEGSVYVQTSSGRPPQDPNNNAVLLLDPQSKVAGELTDSAEVFCHAFPNRFYYVDDRRGLAAGFHLIEGFFRDDQPLVEKVLSDAERKELDQLWTEFDFVMQNTETLIRGFVWFERSERHVLHDERFDFLRSEDPRLVEPAMLDKFERVYLEKMGVKLKEDSLEPEDAQNDRYLLIHGFFEDIRAGLNLHRKQLQIAEQDALGEIDALARRAHGRSLRQDETESLHTLYRSLRKQGQGVEDALRGLVTAILMSPDFCYRFTETPGGTEVYPLSDQALANRLSYFLWSSLPDEKLLAAAQGGQLQDKAALLAQTRRMIKNPRVESFAQEFLGQWLRYRDYLSKDPINAEAFPGYSDELREAMFAEPVKLATWLIQEDRPITDLLTTDTTFLNGTLARHYGGPIAQQYNEKVAKWTAEHQRRGTKTNVKPDEVWHQVSGLREAGRGGLFGMGVILTKNSSGERTSPVKRGFWTVHHLLGQHFPPPPADVPELPKNEKEAAKTIRELIADHTANPRCAMCHTHFDSLGMALEGFDPIGRTRTKDLAGRPIDDLAVFPNGETAKGIPGLIEYVEENRRDDFVKTFCRKFLGYALGRSVMLSDQPLLTEMEEALAQNNYRFSVLFETVVRSPQFRQQRGREFVAGTP